MSGEIGPGEVVALVGPSGAGKTSVARALVGLLPVAEGEVWWGEEAAPLGSDAWRAGVAWAGQDTLLFDASVEENLRLVRPEASEADVRRAAVIAGADAFIQALPDGYATRLGERGARLSGGQRQRLALARALLKGGHLLIIDEAFSGLEPALRAQVLAAIRAEAPERAVLLIAHDPATQALADRRWPLPSPTATEPS